MQAIHDCSRRRPGAHHPRGAPRQAGRLSRQLSLLVGHEERHVDCVNHRDPRGTRHAQQSDGARHRQRHEPRRLQQQGDRQRRRHARAIAAILPRPAALAAAEIDTRPQLEIHADEVKCAHGATTGRLDPDMLFYMLSRGLDRDTAQSLLVYAFLADVLTGMSVASARAAIEIALIAQLPDSQHCGNSDEKHSIGRPARQFRRARGAPPLSHAGAHRARPAAGLSGQRRLGAASRLGHRGRGRLRTPSPRQHPPRRAHAESGSDRRCTKAARDRLVRVHQCPLAARRSFSCAAPPKRSIWWRRAMPGPCCKPGDEILITHLEHHANIVPWQMVCEQTGATLVVAPIDSHGEVHADAVVALMTPRTRLLACAHVSNALGHGSADPAPDRRRQGARHRHLDRRRASRLTHAGRRAGTGLRFLCVLRPQDVRSHRRRRAVRARAAARAHAAVAGRRRDDPGRDVRQDHLQRIAE